MKKQKRVRKTARPGAGRRGCGFAGGAARCLGVSMLLGLLLLLPGAWVSLSAPDPEAAAHPAALGALYLGAVAGGMTAMLAVRGREGETTAFLSAVCGGAAWSVLLLSVCACVGHADAPVRLLPSLLCHLALPACAALGAFAVRRRGRRPTRR